MKIKILKYNQKAFCKKKFWLSNQEKVNKTYKKHKFIIRYEVIFVQNLLFNILHIISIKYCFKTIYLIFY